MGTLPDSLAKPKLNLFRLLTGVLATALVIAVAEVVALFSLYEGRLQAEQLALAGFANVATLGSISVVLLIIGWLTGVLLGLPFRGRRYAAKAAAISIFPAVGGAALVYHTNTFGLTVGLEHPLTAPIAGVLAGAIIGLGVWRIGVSNKPTLMNLTRGVAIVVWLACSGAAGVAFAKTGDYVTQWAQRYDGPVVEVEGERPNLILAVLDTLRADRVGSSEGPSLTPNLDRLSYSSISYDNAISTAPWTLPVHASLLTGRYSDGHGVSWGHYKLEDDVPVLGELLKKRGYETFAVSNNWLLNEQNGFARGFDQFIETTGDPILNQWRLALRCGAVKRLAIAVGLSPDTGRDKGSAWTNWLLRRKFAQRDPSGRPFFALLNYFEPHDPYIPPERFLHRFLKAEERAAFRRLPQSEEKLAAHACGLPGIYADEQIELLSRLYDAEVAYQDEVVGKLVEMLEDFGLLQNTWLVVTSDHGELFGEWDMVFHTASSHYRLLHVPLLVRPPGGVEGRRLASPVQPVDVFATLLEQAGAPVPSSVGRAYRLPLTADHEAQRTVCVAQSHGASISGLSISQRLNMQADLAHWLRWVDSVYADGYLLELDSRGHRMLFDVASDPAMVEDLAGKKRELADLLVRKFESWAGAPAAMTNSVSNGRESEVSDEVQAHAQVSDRGGVRPANLPRPGQ